MMEHFFQNADKKNSHGSSAFANSWEIRKVLKPSNKGIYLANDLRLTLDKSTMHSVIIGPSGMTKSTAFAYNNALRPWKDPVGLVFFDPSGDLYQNCGSYLRKMGFLPRKIDLNHPEESESINPLLFVTNKNEARHMAQALVEGVYKQNTSDPFWSESAVMILTVVIFAMAKKVPPQNRTLYLLAHLINKFNPSSQEHVDALIESAFENDPQTSEEYAAFNANSFKVRQSILATVKSCLYSFSDPVMQRICSRNSFHFSELRERKTVLFLSQREDMIPYNRAFWALLFHQLFHYLMEGGSQPVHCFLDEFSSYKIPNFTAIISTIRRRNVGLHLMLQSYEQLEEIYNPTQTRTIFQNCATKVFLPGLSLQTCRLVSDMLGNATELYSQTQKDFFAPDNPRYRVGRQLLTPDEVRRLKDGRAIVVHINHKPMLVRMTPYFNNRTLKRRTKN